MELLILLVLFAWALSGNSGGGPVSGTRPRPTSPPPPPGSNRPGYLPLEKGYRPIDNPDRPLGPPPKGGTATTPKSEGGIVIRKGGENDLTAMSKRPPTPRGQNPDGGKSG